MTLVGDFNSSVNVPFSRMRVLHVDGALQAGVPHNAHFLVTQRAAGANMSVDVAAGRAWVSVSTTAPAGLAHVSSDTTANVTVTASNATNPRVDQIILRWNDTSIPTGSGNVPTLEVLTGTATSGATLDNRTGAAALPNDCLRLADILVPATSTSVTTANIRDRRPWCRGVYSRIVRTAGNYSLTATVATEIDTTNLRRRVECSGVPLRLTLSGMGSVDVANQVIIVGFFLDGAGVDSTGALYQFTGASTGIGFGFNLHYVTVPTAGSHLVSPTAWVTTGTKTLLATAGNPLTFTVEELVRLNSDNT